MPRLACALARLLTQDPLSPATSTPGSPAPRKLSFKSKPTWRSSSVHGDNRNQTFKCPFSATNALTAATKKEIHAYTSSEEIRSPSHGSTLSTNNISESEELSLVPASANIRDRRSLGVHLEHSICREEKNVSEESIPESTESTGNTENNEDAPSTSASPARRSSLKHAMRKNSCTVALDIHKRRGSSVSLRPRLNSLSLVNADKLNALKEKLGTSEKVMHFFGRCFVKFFSNYG